jgi:hypothetical protein
MQVTYSMAVAHPRTGNRGTKQKAHVNHVAMLLRAFWNFTASAAWYDVNVKQGLTPLKTRKP